MRTRVGHEINGLVQSYAKSSINGAPGGTRTCEARTCNPRIGKAKIKSQLIAELDPDQWDPPPKSQRMALAHL
jgi:hypothetical protein